MISTGKRQPLCDGATASTSLSPPSDQPVGPTKLMMPSPTPWELGVKLIGRPGVQSGDMVAYSVELAK